MGTNTSSVKDIQKELKSLRSKNKKLQKDLIKSEIEKNEFQTLVDLWIRQTCEQENSHKKEKEILTNTIIKFAEWTQDNEFQYYGSRGYWVDIHRSDLKIKSFTTKQLFDRFNKSKK